VTPAAAAIIGLVAAERLVEMVYATRNARALLRLGAIEVGREQHAFFVALHAAWLLAIALFLPDGQGIDLLPLTAFALLQVARLWTIASLGRFWTTRIITLPGAPLVRRGPYRWIRHPNYAIVTAEIALLPLVWGETAVAVVFSLLNAALLVWRIRVEDSVLAERRSAEA
jgi:methyltransferase